MYNAKHQKHENVFLKILIVTEPLMLKFSLQEVFNLFVLAKTVCRYRYTSRSINLSWTNLPDTQACIHQYDF